MHPRFDPPTPPPAPTPEAPDAILAALREGLRNPTTARYAEAARYLAYRGRGWEPTHREEVVAMLREHAADAASEVLARVSAFPRQDVRDDAVDVLRGLAQSPEGVAVLTRHYRDIFDSAVHDVVARCLADARGATVDDARAALLDALASTNEYRREYAADALAVLNTFGGRVVLGPAVIPEVLPGVVSCVDDASPGAATAPATASTPRRTPALDAESIAAAIAAHPTRSAAAAALGVDTSYLRRLARRYGVAWPEPAHAPGTAGGKWSGDNRREAAREWMRRRRAARAARKGDAGSSPEGVGEGE